MPETEEKQRHFKLEVKGLVEKSFGSWKSWRCELETSPYDRTFNEWNFIFTLPIDNEGKQRRVWLELDYGMFKVEELVYEDSKIIKRNPHSLIQQCLNEMFNHACKIKQEFAEKHGLY